MKKLLNEMNAFGLTFNQKDSLVEYPIKEFLKFYQIELKKDLKRKINITYRISSIDPMKVALYSAAIG
jgi:hypothetical protein